MCAKYHFRNIIGRSNSIKELRALMTQAIDSDMDLLITGETGTGKELVAREIHLNSLRKDGPLLVCNCGAGPKELIASELLGHRDGAFIAATQHRIGAFEMARGGTIILDEIGDMPPELQLNLLCVLEGRKVQRMGEHESRDIDVRVIAISNRDLAKEVEAGRFRGDLYGRPKSFHITVPPLRERQDDIPLLARHFYREACNQMTKAMGSFAPGVLGMLQNYRWPGNVRELRNAVYQASALAEEGECIQIHHFPSQIFR
ncbi:sigma 54-interacting transcriptional regulator [Candidatus Poribacteria bacterium]